jgi:LysR family hca operon transcriptional activator
LDQHERYAHGPVGFCLSERPSPGIASDCCAGGYFERNFYHPSKAAPAVRRAVLEYFNRAGIDLKPEHEVHNVVHAISMITSTRAVMLLPAYTKRYLPESITTRPVKGEVPTLDLVIAYHKANNSPILKLLLSRVGKLAGAAS